MIPCGGGIHNRGVTSTKKIGRTMQNTWKTIATTGLALLWVGTALASICAVTAAAAPLRDNRGQTTCPCMAMPGFEAVMESVIFCGKDVPHSDFIVAADPQGNLAAAFVWYPSADSGPALE